MYTSICVLVVVLLTVGLPAEGAKKYPDNKGAASLTGGSHKKTDVNLYHMSLKTKSNIIPQTVQTKDICFPDDNYNKQSKFVVTEYSIKDMGKGGLAYLKKGTGVGKNKVCFHVKSKRGQGYHFDIDIWGKYVK